MSDKIQGMIFAHAIGDALGVPHEFARITPKIPYTGIINTKYELKVQWQFASTIIPPASTSDDTAMAIALLEVLIQNKFKYNKDQVILSYINFANSSTIGMGKNTRRLFKGIKTIKGYLSRYEKFMDELIECQSNGSLMRAYPLALIDNDEDYALTNPNNVNRDCNKVYIDILKKLLTGKTKLEIQKEIITDICEPVKQAISDSLQEKFTRDISGKSKGWVVHSLSVSLFAFWKFESLQDAFSFVINIPYSDTDTNAAITGALFGAYLGISGMEKEKMTKENMQILSEKITLDIKSL